jgi:hypothetical protein
MINVNNMERNIAIARTNHRYLYYSFFNNKEFIIVMCRKSVLIDTFVLNKIISIIVKIIINP